MGCEDRYRGQDLARSCGLPGILFLLAIVGWPGLSWGQRLPAVQGPVATLDRTTFAAAGRHEVMLTVARFGRFAIIVASEQGMSLQAIGRMVGPGQVAGSPGSRDGRLDLFLDEGEYKIVAIGHEHAQGEATLAVHPFKELSPNPAAQLIDLKPVATTLGDFEQRSYWLEVESRRWVHIEAAGRTLHDMRLWRDGSWLRAGEPTQELLEPLAGQPLLACRLSWQVEPGLYLLTLYGGQEQPWAENSDQYPLHLKLGIATLGTAGRGRHEVCPLGIDRYLVPAAANFYRLELPEAVPAELRVGDNAKDPYTLPGNRALIDKESRQPVAEILHQGSETNLVTVSADAGQPYIIQHFERRSEYSFSGPGQYWLSTVHSGHPTDSVDATAIMARYDSRGKLQRAPHEAQTIELDDSHGWARRCNLLADLTVFLHVKDTGEYSIESRGVEARFRIEPFMVYRPRDYRPPNFRKAPTSWDLDGGWYVLTIKPVKKGIMDVAVSAESLLGDLFSFLGQDSEAAEPVQASVRFASVDLHRGERYGVWVNEQPGVSTGIILRELPMSLADPLPLTIRPGRQVAIRFKTDEEVELQAPAEDGSRLLLSLDEGAWAQTHRVGYGEHLAIVRNPGEETVVCSVGAVPVRLLTTAALPPLPPETLAALPDFPVLTPAAPRHFDLAQGASKTFLVKADRDGLYRLESTGLLDTGGTVRSRTVTSLATSDGGGSGRNFFLHQYLRQGDYQVTVRSRGSSAGHLGLALTRTDPIDGGELKQGLPARTTLADGESAVYRFAIPELADYTLRSVGLGSTARCRLEDSDGWPIVKPNIEADLRHKFRAGEYRLVLLPEPVSNRRLTLLEEITPPPRFTGHGPHQLPLDTAVEHRWLEPAQGQDRTPDSWAFFLPAETELNIRLGTDMAGKVYRTGESAEVAATARGSWKGTLAAGSYRCEVVCARINNRVDYQIEVRPEALLAGSERAITAPTAIPVATGGGLVEITSFGTTDVRARLRDDQGQVVARGDDRANDWNFHLAARLAAGAYTLDVQPVGTAQAATTLRLESREEVLHDPVTLPLDIALEPGTAVHLFPLQLPAAEILLASARSAETVGLALEVSENGDWRTVVSRVDPVVALELPLVASARYRLRLWSVDLRDNSVKVMAVAATPKLITEDQLASGLRLSAVAGFKPAVALAKVQAATPGTLHSSNPGLRWSASPGQALGPARRGLLPLATATAWIASDPGRLAASRVRLSAAETLQIALAGPTTALVDLASDTYGLQLVMAESMTGQPAVAVVSVAEAGQPLTPSLAGTAIAAHTAVTVSLGTKQPAALVWLADAAGLSEPVDIRLRQMSFSRPQHLDAGFGSWSGEVAAGTAVAMHLPSGSKRFHLGLSPGLVAVVAAGQAIESVHSNGHAALVESFDGIGSTLLLLASEQNPARYTLEMQAAKPRQRLVAAGKPYAEQSARAGTTRLRVKGAADQLLHVVGASQPPTFGQDQGTVHHGQPMLGSAAGTLLVPHQPGLVMAWLGPQDNPAKALWAGVKVSSPDPVAPPKRLRGEEKARAARLTSPGPQLLEIRSSGPGLFRLTTSASQQAWVVPTGAVRHFCLPQGTSELAYRAVADNSFDLELATTPITEVGDGIGPEVLLVPGAGQAFRFTVTEPGQIGVGVRADSDTVDCELITPEGIVLGSGVVQMHRLEPGDYLLLVHMKPAGTAVRARPAVVGLSKPPTGPPAEVVREYLDMERSDR